MTLSILLNLLLVFFILFFFGNELGKKGATLLCTFNMILCFSISEFIFFERFNINQNNIELIKLGKWFSIFEFSVTWDLLIDNLSIVMLLVVITVSTCVHTFSIYYMETDKQVVKFFSYLTLFTFFMCLLIVSSNFLLLFVGWEGVGLCSFLLISFWSSRVQANKAAMKAMLINRVGDFFSLIAIIFILINFSTLDYFAIFAQVPFYSLKIITFYNMKVSIIDLVAFFISLGALTKSAQLGFHGWLPDAMEGPTPVSALIHAATMVTAGVFLLIRTSFIIEFSEFTLKLLIYVGSLTAFIFGVIGFFQFDIKKIIAFSTCSQLGFMVLACGLSGYNLAFFHLFTHAFFKALLFLSAGSYIHLLSNEQDIRKMSRSFEKSPAVSIFFIIGSFTLMGFPFLSSFFSKEPILQLAFLYNENFVIFILVQIASVFTILYSLKIFYYLYFKNETNKRTFFKNPNNQSLISFYANSVLLFLCVLSMVAGYFTKTLFIGLGNNFFYGSIFIKHSRILDVEFIPFFYKLLPFILFITLAILFYIYIVSRPKIFIKEPFISYNISMFFNKRLFFDSLLNLFIVFPIYRLSYKLFFLFDKGLLEVFGSYGISKITKLLNRFNRKFFTTSYNLESVFIMFHVIIISTIALVSIMNNTYFTTVNLSSFFIFVLQKGHISPFTVNFSSGRVVLEKAHSGDFSDKTKRLIARYATERYAHDEIDLQKLVPSFEQVFDETVPYILNYGVVLVVSVKETSDNIENVLGLLILCLFNMQAGLKANKKSFPENVKSIDKSVLSKFNKLESTWLPLFIEALPLISTGKFDLHFKKLQKEGRILDITSISELRPSTHKFSTEALLLFIKYERMNEETILNSDSYQVSSDIKVALLASFEYLTFIRDKKENEISKVVELDKVNELSFCIGRIRSLIDIMVSFSIKPYNSQVEFLLLTEVAAKLLAEFYHKFK